MWHELKTFLQMQSAVPQIWWRDDDATEDSKALHNYLQALPDTPILLAVIADNYNASLVARIKTEEQIKIAQHGFRHVNHASYDEKKCEYPKSRPVAEVKHELQTGKAKLQKDFGKQFLSVFVPPWNRIDDKFLPYLIESGFKGISMFKGTNQTYPIKRIDSQIDIINWKQNKKFIGTDNFINALIDEIKAGSQIIGILTHHKIHDKAVQSFLLDFHKFITDNQNLIQVRRPPF